MPKNRSTGKNRQLIHSAEKKLTPRLTKSMNTVFYVDPSVAGANLQIQSKFYVKNI